MTNPSLLTNEPTYNPQATVITDVEDQDTNIHGYRMTATKSHRIGAQHIGSEKDEKYESSSVIIEITDIVSQT
ncbi:hypothetical protein KIN20_023727 [Parelaphostrongylus tenuis]|uniref:Uncharacterized protein n=1 Tax=Parelaphostrongylus tenuis TaxID=148309 RepID=A0AAD5QVI4_PARTN|nr:hypothetical protein KIN20_023727 [Parelaphostrongylus tenuis]